VTQPPSPIWIAEEQTCRLDLPTLMDKVKIKTNSAELFYSGVFAQPAFDLFGGASPQLYKDILAKLGPYGAALSTLKVDTSALADTNISCGLPTVNGLFRVRLDRFDLNFVRYHEVGLELGNAILVECWNVLASRDPSAAFAEHAISMNVNARMVDRPFVDLVTRFAQIPKGFPPGTQAAVGYYFAPDETTGLRLFSVIFDRTVDPEVFNFRIEFGFRGDLASAATVGAYVDSFLQKQFDILGMSWE
jgi:hypothetical protein